MRFKRRSSNFLTQQYEIAQIQEAKDIPVLAMIDYPCDPGEEVFSAPRLLLTIVADLVCSGRAVGAFILFRHHWGAIDPGDPRRQISAPELTTRSSRLARNALGPRIA